MMGNTGTPAITTILYVDDEPALLDIGKAFLEENRSFTVEISHSAPDALSRLSSRKYDAIVSDYQMPKMDGIAFLKTLRAQGNTTPFIIFTGRGREDVVIEALNSGADFYLQKGGDPVSQFAELEHKILHAISQKRADLALKKSEQEYRHLIEHAGEAIFITQDEVFRLVNPQAIILSGYSEEELINQPFTRLVHPDEVATLLDNFRKRISGSNNLPSHYVFRIRRKDGILRWVELNVVAITWDNRPAILNFMADITDRKLAEDALRESEERYRQVFRTTLDCVFITSPEGDWIDFNDATVKMFGGSSREEIAQKNIHSFYVNPEERAPFFQKVVEMGYIKETPLKLKKLDGTIFEVLVTSVPLKNPDGLTKAITGTIRDITDRKLAETAIRESDERYRQIFRTTLDGLFLTTLEGEWIDFNDATIGMFGCRSREEIFSIPIRDFYMDSKDRDEVVQRTLREGYIKEYPLKYKRRNGTAFDALMTVVAWKNPDGSTRCFIGTLRDVTEKKRTEDALRESEEHYRQFFRTTLDGLFITARDGRWIDFNDAIVDLLGYPNREALFGIPITSVYAHPEEREIFIEQVERDGYVREYPVHLRKRDGSLIYGLMTVALQRNPDGSTKAIIGTIRDVTEKKCIEDALRESEERYRMITGMITDFIWDWDIRTGCVQWFGDIDIALGYAQGEFPRTFEVWEHNLHPEDHDRVMNAIRRSLETGERFDVEYRILARNGTCRHFHDRGTTIADTEGARVRMIGAVTDITERRNIEESLRESEERYRRIFESFEDLYYQTDMDGIITILSPSVHRLTGYTETELIGQPVIKIYMNPEDRGILLNELETSGNVRDYEVLLCKKDGTPTLASLSANRIYHTDGTPAGVAGSLRDISRRKRAEEALKESEAKFRSLVDHALEAILITDLQGNVLFANNAAARTLDAENSAVLMGRNVMEVIAPESRADVVKDFEEVARGHDAYVARYHLITLKGRDVFVESIGKVITYEGKPADIISLRDVTGQKQ